MKKKITFTAAGFAFGLFLLWAAFRNIDSGRLYDICARANLIFLPLIVSAIAGELILRGIKWKLLLEPAGRTGVWDCVKLETAALALNNVLPLRLGEIARCAYGAEFFKMPIATILASILAEKALDIAALLTMAFIVISSGVVPALNLGSLPVLAVGLAAAAVLVFFALSRLSKNPKISATLAQLKLGFAAASKPLVAIALFACALLQWFLNSLGYYFTAKALGLSPMDPLRGIAMSVTGATASSVPGMPGAFGSIEFAVAALMKTWGFDGEASLAGAAGAHMAAYLVITALGITFLYGFGGSLANIRKNLSTRPEN